MCFSSWHAFHAQLLRTVLSSPTASWEWRILPAFGQLGLVCAACHVRWRLWLGARWLQHGRPRCRRPALSWCGKLHALSLLSICNTQQRLAHMQTCGLSCTSYAPGLLPHTHLPCVLACLPACLSACLRPCLHLRTMQLLPVVARGLMLPVALRDNAPWKQLLWDDGMDWWRRKAFCRGVVALPCGASAGPAGGGTPFGHAHAARRLRNWRALDATARGCHRWRFGMNQATESPAAGTADQCEAHPAAVGPSPQV